jgi:hypothetical protein
LIGWTVPAAAAALGFFVLLVACSSESLTKHPGGGSGGSTSGSGGGFGGDLGSGGDYGGAGGDIVGAGSSGTHCVQSSDCNAGLYCSVASCGSSSYYDSCQPLFTTDGACDMTNGPVCGCDGKQYDSLCDAYDSGTTATYGACPAPVGSYCVPGYVRACTTGAYCQLAACGDTIGLCQTMPDAATCTGAGGPVCSCDNGLFSSACVAASYGANLRNVGACAPLPSGPCSSQADCGGDSYADVVTCVPNVCNSTAGTCMVITEACQILISSSSGISVCGCDGQTYPDGCAAYEYGVTVAHQGPCETP